MNDTQKIARIDTALLRQLKEQDLRQFLEETEGIEFNKNGMGLCPFHDDHNPSLSIQRENGVQRWKCFSCGTRDSIIGWIMKKQCLEFKEAAEWGINYFNLAPKEKKVEHSTKGFEERIVTAYSYTDENRKELFQVVRFKEPKEFKAKHKENGEWIWDVVGINPILYHLDKILKAKEVWLTEGEKDVRTIESLGLTATTWPFGIKNWKPEFFAKEFKDKKVNICLDEDARELALKVAGDIFNAEAEQIKVIYLPELKNKEDVSDWVDKKDTEDREGLGIMLQEIADKTAPFELESPLLPETKDSEGVWAQAVKYMREEIDHGQKFTRRAICSEVGAFNAEDKKKVSNAIGYLANKEEKEVIRGSEVGFFTKAPAKLVAIDLMPDDEETYLEALTIPLLGKDVKIARGDLLLIGGFTSTGKTAMGLNLVLQNQALFPSVDYFSTQAGQVRQRIQAFKTYQGLKAEDWKMKLYERTEDYASVINPDNLTIIDFLDEKEGEYYKIGGRLSRIHDRIENQKGLVIVFMQKPPNRPTPYGHFQTHSYANFVAMLDDMGDEGEKQKQLTIIKSKMSPKHERKVIRYKIENDGTKIIALTPLEYKSNLDALKSPWMIG